jgi:hypothetical protein
LLAVNRGRGRCERHSVEIAGFDTPGRCAAGSPVKQDGVYTCTVDGAHSQDAKPTTPYFTTTIGSTRKSGHQHLRSRRAVRRSVRAHAVSGHLACEGGDVEVTKDVPVEFRYVKDLYFGDKRMELNVVPAFSVRITPELAVIPAPRSPAKPVSARSTFR